MEKLGYYFLYEGLMNITRMHSGHKKPINEY